jgi:hypothetical protein
MQSSHTQPQYRSGSSVTQHLTRNSAQIPGIKGKHLQTTGPAKGPQDSASRPHPLFTVEESIRDARRLGRKKRQATVHRTAYAIALIPATACAT